MNSRYRIRARFIDSSIYFEKSDIDWKARHCVKSKTKTQHERAGNSEVEEGERVRGRYETSSLPNCHNLRLFIILKFCEFG